MLKTEFEATPENRAPHPSHRGSRTDKLYQSILFNFAEVNNRLILGLKKKLYLICHSTLLLYLTCWRGKCKSVRLITPLAQQSLSYTTYVITGSTQSTLFREKQHGNFYVSRGQNKHFQRDRAMTRSSEQRSG